MNQEGYTLIEILIALTVFAILATITSSALYHAFENRTRVNATANQLNELQLAISLIERDSEQAIDRAVRRTEQRVIAPFVGQKHYTEWSRNGLVNPNGMLFRSTLQRVALICKDKKLFRRSWDRLDSMTQGLYQDKILLANLEACSFAYLTSSGQALPEWRPYAVQENQKAATLPIAIQLNLTLAHLGNMSLLFALPETFYEK